MDEYVPLTHRYPAMAFGIHQSLYHTLTPSSVHLLEEAICLTRIFSFPSALAIFNTFDAPEKFAPVISIEHSQALFTQGNHGAAARVLRDALAYANSHHQAEGDDEWSLKPEYRLLRVMLGLVECFSEGTFVRGVEALNEMRLWLRDVRVEDYTDIQVSLYSRGHFLSPSTFVLCALTKTRFI